MVPHAHIDHYVALQRGFDLGDDAELLELMAARAAAGEAEPAQWFFYGLLLFRAHRWAQCARAMVEVPEGHNDHEGAVLLAAHALIAGEAANEALATLRDRGLELVEGHETETETETETAPRDQEPADTGVCAQWFAHARGLALVSLGQRDAGLAAIRAGLATEDSGARRLDLAWVLADSDPRVALHAATQALTLDEDLPRAHYLIARLSASLGEADAALAAIERAIDVDTDAPSRAREDPHFADLREDPRFISLTRPPAPADTSWWSEAELPRWLSGLRNALAAADAPGPLAELEWLSREASEAASASQRERYAEGYHLGLLWLEAAWAACQEIVSGCVVLATGPSLIDANGSQRTARLIWRPAGPPAGVSGHRPLPDQLWLALDDDVPAILWIEVGRELASIAAALGEFFPAQNLRRHEFRGSSRALMGYRERLAVPSPYSGELEPADPHNLSRHFVMSPLVNAPHWGSSRRDDPWPQRIPPQPGYMLKITNHQREVQRQEDGGVCSFTRRTIFSRSYLGIELHQTRLYVWDLRYTPSRHRPVIERLNARCGLELPTDLPFDVAGAIMGFDFIDADNLRAGLEHDQSDAAVPYIHALAAVACHNLTQLTQLSRPFVGHPSLELRGAVFNVAATYNLEFIIEELLAREPDDSELMPFLRRALDHGPRPEQFDEHGEPADIYDDHDDHDEHDEHDEPEIDP